MVDGILVICSALMVGGLAIVAPWEAATATMGVLWFVAPRLRRIVVFCALLGFCLSAWRAGHMVQLYEKERRDVASLLPRVGRCSAKAVVSSSPVRVHGVMRWGAWLSHVECKGQSSSWQGKAMLYGGPNDLVRGDQLEISAQLAMPQRLWNKETGDPRPTDAYRGTLRSGSVKAFRVLHRGQGPKAWIDHARNAVRTRIQSSFPASTEAMARALVLGETDLTDEDNEAFRKSGLAHLLAVSGMHLILVVLGIVKVLQAILVRVEQLSARFEVGRFAAFIGIPLAWLYAEFSGKSGSAIRAAWMLTIMLCARVLARKPDTSRSIGLSMGAMALITPLVAYDFSFLLSISATAGIVVGSKQLEQILRKVLPSWLGSLASSAAVSIVATLACAPILVWLAPTLPLGGVFANLLAAPLGEVVALPLCLVHPLLSFWPAAERGSALIASGALELVRRIAHVSISVPFLSLPLPTPTGWQLAVVAIAVASQFFLEARARRRFLVFALSVLMGLEIKVRREEKPTGVLRATFLDVGQGDGALVDLPDGRAVLIDGGGLVGSSVDLGKRVIAPVLRARRRARLAMVILSHPHPDHYLGLMSGVKKVEVDALWDTGQGEAEEMGGGYAALLSDMQERKVPILRPAQLCGCHEMGGAMVDVLAPCPDFLSERSVNDNSFVLRISYGDRAFLFVGDAEKEEEEVLLTHYRETLHADVLKVGHHGSRTSSTPDFLQAVNPREAVISSGVRNRYGHPHPSTLTALGRIGVRLWRTDEEGAVTIVTDGQSLKTYSMRRH